MGSISYVREIPSDQVIIDTEHRRAVIDRDVFLRIDEYATSTPTGPSAGRVYRRSHRRVRFTVENAPKGVDPGTYYLACPADKATEHWLYIVENAPESDPRGGQLHHPHQAFLVQS